ncbi:MAG: DNA repair protein RadC [Oscillospiraceae bacterium]|nr:DNA repair protein RadC [Oscillospiraceae bacterium]
MAKGKDNVHAGHRERMRSKYLRVGFEGFEEHEILEMLLYNFFSQQDTNELAHRLISAFGSVKGVLTASVDQLKAVKGIGEVSAFNLKLIGDIALNSMQSKKDDRPVLDDSDKTYAYVEPFFSAYSTEMVLAVSLDSNLKVMRTTKIHEGSFDSVSFNIAKVVRNLVASGAAGVVIAHNHPSGCALPSERDLMSTEKLKRALESVGIMFVDHIILGENDYVSFRASGNKLYTIA